MSEPVAEMPNLRQEVKPNTYPVFAICSVPLALNRALLQRLQPWFPVGWDAERARIELRENDLLTETGEAEWILSPAARSQLLSQLERESRGVVIRLHAEILKCLKEGVWGSSDPEVRELQEAYHTVPGDAKLGNDLYWTAYCHYRVNSRHSVLSLLAELAESQARWLRRYGPYVLLYSAAANRFAGLGGDRDKAEQLLAGLVNDATPFQVRLDAAYMLGSLREYAGEIEEATALYREVVNLREKISRNQPQDVRRHLALTVAKAYSGLAGIYQASGEFARLAEAEQCYRFSAQITSAEEQPALEATSLKGLIGVQKRLGFRDADIQAASQRIDIIEHSARTQFWEDAVSHRGDWDYQYYAISALKHGLGYELQRVNMLVEPNGSAQIKGMFILRAMSMLGAIDTYLITVPESQAGVRFLGIESLSPEFMLDFKSIGIPKSARIGIDIEPPMRPGEQLVYRWTARAGEGTFATTPEQLQASGAEFEYVSWQIIAPMRQLEISVSIPSAQTEPLPPYWLDLWRMGPALKPGTASYAQAAQTAYRAQLGGGTERVSYSSELEPPGRRRLRLQVQYPWLAMRYVLAWKVE
jgi:hypothetical protein